MYHRTANYIESAATVPHPWKLGFQILNKDLWHSLRKSYVCRLRTITKGIALTMTWALYPHPPSCSVHHTPSYTSIIAVRVELGLKFPEVSRYTIHARSARPQSQLGALRFSVKPVIAVATNICDVVLKCLTSSKDK